MATVTYYFNSYDVEEAWETDPEEMVDGSVETLASTVSDGDIELCNINTCPGTDLGEIIKIEIRAWGNSSASNILYLRPVFGGGDGDNHNSSLGDSGEWTSWIDITNDTNAPVTWSWANVQDLDLDVELDKVAIGGASIGRIEISVTYTASGETQVGALTAQGVWGA